MSYTTGDADYNSKIDRVRLRVTRLMHRNRDRNLADGSPAHGMSERQADPERETTASRLLRLAEDLRALQLSIEDSEQLIRQAWNVAGDLNKVRRNCNSCDVAGGLSEAIGFYQGMLNRWRHNVRAAAKAVDNMQTLLAQSAEPGASSSISAAKSDEPAADAACAPVYGGAVT